LAGVLPILWGINWPSNRVLFFTSMSGYLTDDSIMPFGDHKGQKMVNVPAKRLLWYYDQQWIVNWPYVKRYIEENIDVLQQEVKTNNDYE
jgi:hypothetical protein